MKFANYEKTYRSSWTEPSGTRKPVSNTRFMNFQQGIVRHREVICAVEAPLHVGISQHGPPRGKPRFKKFGIQSATPSLLSGPPLRIHTAWILVNSWTP